MTEYEKEQQRTAWLCELKTGDDVFIRSRGEVMSLATVVSRTPKRNDIIVVPNGHSLKVIFDSRGVEKTTGYYHDVLVEHTQENADKNEAKKQEIANFNAVKSVQWNTVSADKLARIAAILKEGK